mmetsp:Transcript_4504/g.13016  ORF Transcript_4504/g.13016 Transcript_4504/m.13016 type:complete len:269 (-) Transcript_4504:61-867(-)
MNTENSQEPVAMEEIARLRRFLRGMALLLLFWFAMLYFLVHHDNGIVIAGIVILCLWVLYMWTCIVYIRFQERRQKEDAIVEEEEAALTTKRAILSDTSDASFPYPIEETGKRIRQCSIPVTLGRQPTDGTYTAVLSAVYFGKAMRSEGKLRLKFLPLGDKGWSIQGESDFGAVAYPIDDGFLNAKGEMYWKTRDSEHRGIFDISSSSMFDGEFIASRSVTTPENQPMGRIVRLELAAASFYSGTNSDIEMVTFGADGSDDEEAGLFS